MKITACINEGLAKIFLYSLLVITCQGCSNLFYQPDGALHYPPENFKLNPERISFRSADQTKLFAWYFKTNSRIRKGTIIQFHGNAENISSHYLSLSWVLDHGWDLFTFDYRGYGKSEGTPSQKGTVEDGIAALEHAFDLHGQAGSGKFVVYGQSLGGAIAMRSHHEFKNRNQTFVIVQDSTFSSYEGIARMKMKSFWLTWPLSALAGLLVSDTYSSKEAIKTSNTRLLVIHDKNDPAVPFTCGKEIYDLASSTKTFWELEMSSHIGVFMPGLVENRMKFLKYLETANPGQSI